MVFVDRGVLSAVVGLGRLGDRQSSPSGPLRWPSRDPGDGQDPVLTCKWRAVDASAIST